MVRQRKEAILITHNIVQFAIQCELLKKKATYSGMVVGCRLRRDNRIGEQ